MTFRFDCDCGYVARAGLLFANIRERGNYWVEDGQLLLTSASGEVTRWPFRFEGDRPSRRV